MIPKKIHYCWFGKNPKSDLVKKCINSWTKYLPDYEIIEWNEDNFDINSNVYCKEAYEAKKWAFVTDYVRVKVLYEHGGIYMDTDVEILKCLDDLLPCEAFLGFEKYNRIQTGIMAASKGNQFFFCVMHDYDNRHFKLPNNELDMTTNVTTITNMLLNNNIKLNNTKQQVLNISIYPTEYFCPKDFDTKIINLTENTYCIHHFDGSWQSTGAKFKYKVLKLLGPNISNFLVKLKHRIK